MSESSLSVFVKRILPPMQIHVWGGLGSQLFALIALEEARSRFRLRSFRIVFHTGGVTKREPDLIELIPEDVEISIINDFLPSLETVSVQKIVGSWRSIMQPMLKKISHKLKFVVSWEDFSRGPSFWTVQIRGHYRFLKISLDSLVCVSDRIFNSKFNGDSGGISSSNAIHFRIGDLIGLKGIIDPDSLESVMYEIQARNHLKFQVLSDSEEIASTYLSKVEIFPSAEGLNTWETIEIGYNSEVFVGTLSKVSYWIVILRVLGRPEMYSYLPSTATEEITSFFRNLNISAKIRPYSYGLIESPEA